MANVDCRYARALQSYTITYPSPDETLLGTPEVLPTSEPATPQISYTIATGHLPMVSPTGLEYVLTALLYAAGKNTDTTSRTVYYRILKNGSSVATGSSRVLGGYFYTWNHCNFFDVQVGDVIACKLWASGANVNWDYKALMLDLTRPGSANVLVEKLAVTLAKTQVLSLGTPNNVPRGVYPYHEDIREIDQNYAGTSLSRRMKLVGQTYRLWRVSRGDYTQSSVLLSHRTYHPQAFCNMRPTALSFRPLTIRV